MFNSFSPLEVFFQVSWRIALCMTHHPVITAASIALFILSLIAIRGVQKEREEDARHHPSKPSRPQLPTSSQPNLTVSHSNSRPKSSQKRRARHPLF